MSRASLLLALGCLLATSAASAAAATSVQVAAVIEGVIQEDVALIGSVVPRRSAAISAQVAGLVASLQVDEGHRVAAQDELFRLDDALARIEVQRARAQLAQADAELAESERKLGEAERLHSEGHIPLSTLETAQTDTAVRRAQRDQRRADLARSRTLMEQHQVLAPFAGTVVSKEAEVGQWIRTDSPVVVLAEMDPVRVEVPLPQHLFDRVASGTGARIRFESLPGETFAATVTNRIPQSRDGARTFPIWLELANEQQRLAPGMSAEVSLAVKQNLEPVLLVPDDALVRRSDGSTLVWVLHEEGDGSVIVMPAQVATGRTSDGLREVNGDNLRVGDLVVVRGNESLRPRQAVRVLGGR